MRVGVVQFRPVFGHVAENLDRIESLLTAGERADLWVVPELATTGYRFVSRDEARAFAEEIPEGPASRRLLELSRGLRTAIVAGIAESRGERIFNAAAVLDRGEPRGVYRKAHLFEDEKDLFDAGDSGLRVFEAAGARVGVLICFDWRFPEAARTLALSGAQLLAHPSNLIRPHAPEAMRTRAIENGVFAVTANRIGTEERGGLPALRFTGQSQIVAPGGELLFRMGEAEEGTRVAEIDLAAADLKTRGRNDLFADRRPELYRT